MAFHYKQCTIQYAARTDGTPAQGYVEFKPNTVLVDSDTGLILNDQTIDAYLDADGKVTVSLLACDSPGITPADWSWNIEEKIDGGSVWWFQITDAMTEPVNLKDLYIPGEAPPTIAVQGPKGDTGDKGAKGDTGDQGEQGPAGQAAVIIGEFTRNPLELPPDGFIPANWDSPGKPAQDHQTVIGQAIHYTPDGHLWSYVGQDLLAAGWQDVGLIVGATGPQGPPGPLSPEDILGGTGITVTENEANGTVTISSSGVADHGQLTGLADDDHTQYHNNTRGDARYDAKGAATSAVNAHVAAADPHTQYLTADDVIPPEIKVNNTEPTEETITLWIDPDAPDYSGVALSDLDERFVNIAGDTMTGPLVLGNGPGIRWPNADKQLYVDESTDSLMVLNIAGGLDNIRAKSPVVADDVATKSYVDGKVRGGGFLGTSAYDGTVTIPHGLGVTPLMVVVCSASSSGEYRFCNLAYGSEYDNVNIYARVYGVSAAYEGTVAIHWIAIVP